MEDKKILTHQESLDLIAKTINKAKEDYQSTGISALLWGSLITFCSLVSFLNYYLRWPVLNYIWFLNIAVVIPQAVLFRKEEKNKKVKGYSDDLIGGIWIGFGIAVFLVFCLGNIRYIPHIDSLYLVLFGIPTFATGYGCGFRAMTIGGIACWIFAVLSMYSPYPYSMLYYAAAALLAWFIPGLVLRRRYQKAKMQHV